MNNVSNNNSPQKGALANAYDQQSDRTIPSTQRHSPLKRMQRCLDQLGIPLRVMWTPNSNSSKHGEIQSGCLIIYDETETDAWATLEHEIYEWKLREVTRIYRTVINNLIEAVEKLAYRRKETFIDSLPHVSEVIRKEKQRPDRSPHAGVSTQN